jgi:lysophospholipase L1-like esterase
VDYAADPRLSDYNNTAYFDADKVHLNDAGYAVCRDLLLPVALPLLNT